MDRRTSPESSRKEQKSSSGSIPFIDDTDTSSGCARIEATEDKQENSSAVSSGPIGEDIGKIPYGYGSSISSSPTRSRTKGDMPGVHRSPVKASIRVRSDIVDDIPVRDPSTTSSSSVRRGTKGDMPSVGSPATDTRPKRYRVLADSGVLPIYQPDIVPTASRPDTDTIPKRSRILADSGVLPIYQPDILPTANRPATDTIPKRSGIRDFLPSMGRPATNTVPMRSGNEDIRPNVDSPATDTIPKRSGIRDFLPNVHLSTISSRSRVQGEVPDEDRSLPPLHVPGAGDSMHVRDRLSRPRVYDGDPSLLIRAERIRRYNEMRRRNGSRTQDLEVRQDPPRNDFVGAVLYYWGSSHVRRCCALIGGTLLTIGGIAGAAYALNHHNSPWGWASLGFSAGASGLYVTCKSLTNVCLDDEPIPRGYYNVLTDTARNMMNVSSNPPSPEDESLPSYDTGSYEPHSTPTLPSEGADTDPLDTTTSMPSFRVSTIGSSESFQSTLSSTVAVAGSCTDMPNEQQQQYLKDKMGSSESLQSALSSIATVAGTSSDLSKEQRPLKRGRRTGQRLRSISESCIQEKTYEEALLQLEFEEMPPYTPEEWEERTQQRKLELKRLPSLEEMEVLV